MVPWHRELAEGPSLFYGLQCMAIVLFFKLPSLVHGDFPIIITTFAVVNEKNDRCSCLFLLKWCGYAMAEKAFIRH